MDEIHQITIIQKDKKIIINSFGRETVLEAMVRVGLTPRTDCGGRGTCGKCRIKIVEGKLSVNEYDRSALTKEELLDGWRLACKAVPGVDIRVLLPESTEAEIEAVTDSRIEGCKLQKNILHAEHYVIGIDLGSTTLAFSLADFNRRTVAVYSSVNPQRRYGADVISRIQTSNEGKMEELKLIIREALTNGIQAVLEKASVPVGLVSKIVIAGNTTMLHLLMGYSCEGLGVYPYAPVNLETVNSYFDEIFHKNNESLPAKPRAEMEMRELLRRVPVTLLPGISAFVGADLVAGLALCGYDSSEKPSLLIDFGTNGEIGLGCRDRILVTSTAAGPAFEGGNITCGVGSIPGAIRHISLAQELAVYETIGSRPPVGLCGTAVVDLAAELFRTGKIDETGLFNQEYFEEGFSVFRHMDMEGRFTQKDIRELQLAKAAVRAGIEILLLRYGITGHQVDKVYLAGGFGFSMNIDNAVRIGLLPEEMKNRIIQIGNSSLAGAIRYATDADFADRVERIRLISKEIALSADTDFYDLYLEYMAF